MTWCGLVTEMMMMMNVLNPKCGEWKKFMNVGGYVNKFNISLKQF